MNNRRTYLTSCPLCGDLSAGRSMNPILGKLTYCSNEKCGEKNPGKNALIVQTEKSVKKSVKRFGFKISKKNKSKKQIKRSITKVKKSLKTWNEIFKKCLPVSEEKKLISKIKRNGYSGRKADTLYKSAIKRSGKKCVKKVGLKRYGKFSKKVYN